MRCQCMHRGEEEVLPRCKKEVGRHHHAPAALTPKKTHYLLYLGCVILGAGLDGLGKSHPNRDLIVGPSELSRSPVLNRTHSYFCLIKIRVT
jgi:hypothetical protein